MTGRAMMSGRFGPRPRRPGPKRHIPQPTHERTHSMRITIIGLGLIGGSAALAWREAFARRSFPGGSLAITAVDTNPATLVLALEKGVADRVTPSIAQGVADADLVLLAVPVLAMGAVMREVDRAAPEAAIITDAGSVRGSVITAVRMNASPERLRHYVPLHPIAGAEKAGLEFATPTLYRGATGVVTPLPETDAGDAAVVVNLWRAAGLSVVEMTPEEHDRVYAMVSHVPHMIAFALMDMAASSPESRTALAAAGGGFRDTTRIAAADARMWADITRANRTAILDGISRFEAALTQLKGLVAADDYEGYKAFFERSAQARRMINAHLPPVQAKDVQPKNAGKA